MAVEAFDYLDIARPAPHWNWKLTELELDVIFLRSGRSLSIAGEHLPALRL